MRNRLVGAVAVVAAAVLGAGAPGLAGTADNANNSQQLVDLAELNARAIALAHSLADERDGMTAYVAAGRGSRTGAGADNTTVNGTGTNGTGTNGTGINGTGTNAAGTNGTGANTTGTNTTGTNTTGTNTTGTNATAANGVGTDAAGVSGPQRARVDRQIGELRSEAQDASGDTAVYAAAAKLLAALPQTRQQALTGPGSAEQIYQAYTQVIQALGAISDDIARGLPARADSAEADTQALPALGRATDQAAGARALLLAGLNAGGSQPRLTAAAQVAHLREQGALGDFEQSASQGARDRYDRTVNGADVNTAERYLTRLTDQPRLDAADLRLSRQRVETALTARIGLMRGVESAMATADIQRLGALRDDDVTELEIRIGLEALCLLLAVGAGIWAARSLTQPLAALRIGARRVAADPAHEEPITYKGRNDEFAAAVRSVNALHAQVGELARRTAELEGERKRLVGGRQRLVAEREVLQEQGETLKEEIADLTERLAAVHAGVHGRFVNLSLRTLGLVERQLGVIESLEESEQDPERLETLFKLDHFAARMRRNSENLLVLAGAEQHGTSHPGPVPLLDVLRAAISEIERYERVRIQSLPPHSQVAGFAADDLSHLVAELLENATAFSPPDAHVELSGWLLESGEVMLSVQDEGIGMTAERMAELNERLTDVEAASISETVDEALGLGLYVVVRLAARHGIRVQLRDAKQGGVTAVIVLPGSILPTRPAPASAPSSATPDVTHTLPGSVAEANSNALQTRVTRVEPVAVGGSAAAAPVPAQETGQDPAEDTGQDTAQDDSRTAEQPAGHDGAPGPGHDDTADAEPAPAPASGPDPFVAAAERAIDAAGLGGTAEPAPAPAAEQPTGPTTHAAGEPGPYGPQSSGPYAATTSGSGEHTRPEDDAAPAVDRAAQPASDPYAIGPDQHTRPGTESTSTDAAPTEADPAPADASPADPQTADAPPAGKRRTATGLPKRTPKVVAQHQAPAAPRKSGAANAEALRRRLGGFQAGARDGRREVEAEIAERTAEQTIPQTDTDGAGAPGESHVVEEARD
ncbi:sensor histidine kinase [Streptomyces inhibens]|uniref:sensor histidine kinase n=1 Tax=Streptomyces inhibens TaxID=2293571 RepID=UPI001EE6AC6C|nr:nitrate- and nitrite sensing domain-containing protein [Streptomyces inhibens]UKY52664.1 nitrate- and nitrite sensing domain-containing protein [Streptomyces inhibens]